ncbi:MAG: DUF6587 family protein [Luteibacter sp.]|uniref:DUF6587 family protein n=1 Tax=Rhodanobacteraceae TaxID=1775411 RepID=UPI0005BA7DEC|nr:MULTISPECIES: DUF6587 family protein [Rhodanobacteraceae]MDQ7994832.1 hypothetical protein [Luteibacter sp.]MDQ8049839.1 hypothetical protein [Luteibacter sp.]MDR6641313.1 hypothetical protein [Luteibacter sp. 1214]SDF58697.1 hypothetical protein SAMN04515659_1295 [Dyella sp. 333MFSha]
MSTFELFQGFVIGVAVAVAAYVAFRKLLPKTSTRVLARVSAWLNRDGRPVMVRSLGKRVQPAAATGSCGDGCGSCGSCGPVAPKSAAQPLEFRPRG